MAKRLILVTLTIFVVIAEGLLGLNLGIGNNECYEKIENGLNQMEEMPAPYVSDIFHFCNDIENEIDVQIFFSAMSEVFSLLAQLDQIANVTGVCDLVLDDDHESPVEAVAAVIVYLLEYRGDECMDIDNDPAVESIEKTLQVVDAIISRISSKFVGTPVVGMLLGLLKVGRR